LTIRTIPSKYKPNGTVVLEIDEIIYFNGTNKIAFLMCWMEHGGLSQIPYSSLVQNEELAREIEGAGKG